MTVAARTKQCSLCGSVFTERARDSSAQWDERTCCSRTCAARVPKATIEERFWSKVDRREADQCWPWLGSQDGRRYGQMSSGPGGGSPIKAHRVSWIIANGPIPEGMNILHRCDNPPCVNPNHLLPGTQKQNIQDASERGRLNPKSLLNLRWNHPRSREMVS